MAGVRPAIGNIYYRCFQTADGFVAVGCLATPLRVKLLGALGMADWRVGKRPDEIDPTDPATLAFCARLIEEAEALFSTKTTDDWLRILDAAGVPVGPLRFTEELLDDPQVIENDYIITVDHPLMGPIRMAGPMIQMSATPLAPQGPSPTLGQHTDSVLRDLGYDDDRIEALRAAGVLGILPG
jgi:formyl-CoA transferase